MKPTSEEAKKDLENIRAEIKAMTEIRNNAYFLATRDDVDGAYYRSVAWKVDSHIIRGVELEKKILDLYPELR